MWIPGSMGQHRGWDHDQARDMFDAMREHGSGDFLGGVAGGLIGNFIDSFASKAGSNIADKVTGGSVEHVIVENK